MLAQKNKIFMSFDIEYYNLWKWKDLLGVFPLRLTSKFKIKNVLWGKLILYDHIDFTYFHVIYERVTERF